MIVSALAEVFQGALQAQAKPQLLLGQLNIDPSRRAAHSGRPWNLLKRIDYRTHYAKEPYLAET